MTTFAEQTKIIKAELKTAFPNVKFSVRQNWRFSGNELEYVITYPESSGVLMIDVYLIAEKYEGWSTSVIVASIPDVVAA